MTWNKSYPEVSLADLDTNEISLEGKTIIIGVKAEGIGGVVTPVGGQYDYTVIANTLQTVIDGTNIESTGEAFLLELGFCCLLLGCAIVILTRFTPYYIVGGLMLAFSAGACMLHITSLLINYY